MHKELVALMESQRFTIIEATMSISSVQYTMRKHTIDILCIIPKRGFITRVSLSARIKRTEATNIKCCCKETAKTSVNVIKVKTKS